MDFLSKIIIIDTAGLFLGKTCHLPQLSHKMFSVLTTVTSQKVAAQHNTYFLKCVFSLGSDRAQPVGLTASGNLYSDERP